AVDPVVAELQRDRRPPHHRLLRPVIVESPHPAAPRVGGFADLHVDVEPVMAMKTTPRQHEIEPGSLTELVGALQSVQPTVGAKVQTKAAPRRRLHLEPGERRTRPRSSAWLDIDLDPRTAFEDGYRPYQFPAMGRRVVTEVGSRTQA